MSRLNPSPTAGPSHGPVNLALQGGGSHGAFTWGVLDALLEDGRLSFEGISGTSADGGGYDLTRERPQEYSSGIFGNLRYEDLKKAHTESIIPVTEDDYYKTKRFNNVNELQTFRDQSRRDLHRETSKVEQERIYQQSRMRQEEEDTRRAFILAKQDEISRDIHKKLYSDMFRLENSPR